MSATNRPAPNVVFRLALTGGRADRLRVILTAAASTIGAGLVLAAVNVVLIGDRGPGRYQNAILDQPGLHQGVVIASVGLLVPLIAFVGQCSRIGAPGRDRRLAAFRLAGASASDVRGIALTETAIAAACGAALGAGAAAMIRLLLPSKPDLDGRLPFPTDVNIPWWAYVSVIVAIPVVAALSAVVAMHKVSINPLGVLRRQPQTAPAIIPMVLLIIGVAGLAFSSVIFDALELNQRGDIAPMATAFVFFVCCAAGLTLGTAAFTQRAGEMIAPRTRRPALLIAARRMIAAPFNASRPTGAVLITVFVAAAMQQTRQTFLLATDPADSSYTATFRLIDVVLLAAVVLAAAGLLVATADSIVGRRRSLAALVAVGTPRRTIAGAMLSETLIPLIPGVLIAVAAGTLAARGVFGTDIASHQATVATNTDTLVAVPIPWTQLGLVGAGTITVAALAAAVALIFLPSSTSPGELRAAA